MSNDQADGRAAIKGGTVGVGGGGGTPANGGLVFDMVSITKPERPIGISLVCLGLFSSTTWCVGEMVKGLCLSCMCVGT